jgi:hypothetical protein
VNKDTIDDVRTRALAPETRIDSDTIPTPNLPAPASVEDVEASEQRLGFSLPPFLVRLYREVGNGGFGPGFGTLGIRNGFTDDEGKTIVDLYEAFLEADDTWPARVLPLWDWGCAVWSCLDCSNGAIVTSSEDGLTRTEFSVEEWFKSWARGENLFNRIFSSRQATMLNPFTQKPMGISVAAGTIGTPLPSIKRGCLASAGT